MATINWNRDTSKDKTLYTVPPTVYTDSTTLTNGMTVYDNTGTDTGYVVGTISGNSFDILSVPEILYGIQVGGDSSLWYLFVDNTNPTTGDKVYDKDANEVGYLFSNSYVNVNNTNYPFTNCSSFMYFSPASDSNWTFTLTSTGYSTSVQYLIASNNSSNKIATTYELNDTPGSTTISDLVTIVSNNNNLSNATLSLHPSIKALYVRYFEGDSEISATSTSNCTVQSYNPAWIIPTSYSQTVAVTLYNDY